jgi:hypothetical protein
MQDVIVISFILQIISFILTGLVGALIGATLLKWVAKWVIKMDVPFGKAYWTMCICFIINFMVGFVLCGPTFLAPNPPKHAPVLLLISGPVLFLIQSGISSLLLKLSFGKACLVTITMTGIVLGIALVICLFRLFI